MSDQIQIRFTQAVDGYVEGYVMTTTPGIADAYVEWRKVAEYVKAVDAPVKNKMMTAPKAKKSLVNA